MKWHVALMFVSVALGACGNSEREKPRKLDLPFDETTSLQSTSVVKEPPAPVTVTGLVADGQHWRLTTSHGAVHVWIPKGFQKRRAETIVYIHGYYVHVDDSWETYQLPFQFAASGINAVFIACDGPSVPAEQVMWPALAPLLDEVEKQIKQELPRRRIVAFGHSAAYRTMLGWLDEPLLDTVVLLDAAYGEIEQYKAWIEKDDKHRLIDVGDNTREWTDKLHASLPDSLVLDHFPTLEEGMPKTASKARILYIKSDLGHFPLVTGGIAIPMILRTLRAKRLLREPLAELLDNK